MSDSYDECRAIDFENRYNQYYGCDSDDEDEDMDEDEKMNRINNVRRSLGWDR